MKVAPVSRDRGRWTVGDQTNRPSPSIANRSALRGKSTLAISAHEAIRRQLWALDNYLVSPFPTGDPPMGTEEAEEVEMFDIRKVKRVHETMKVRARRRRQGRGTQGKSDQSGSRKM